MRKKRTKKTPELGRAPELDFDRAIQALRSTPIRELEKMANLSDALTELMTQVDKSIELWASYPEEKPRAFVESESIRKVFDLLPETERSKARDLCIIRIQCAEAFCRMAKEHAGLVSLRLKMEV